MFTKIDFESNDSENLIGAKTDLEAIAMFYKEKKASTQRSFEREIRRFMYWLDMQGLSLKEIKHIHVKSYMTLLENPPPEACGPPVKFYKTKDKSELNPDWRPFIKPLSKSSIKTSLNLLSSFGKWLTDAGYIDANPFSLVNKNSDSESTLENQDVKTGISTDHHFTPIEMLWIHTALSELTNKATTTKKRNNLIRAEFIITFLRRTGLRREEMVKILNSNIKKLPLTRSDKTIYALLGIGKGDKGFTIPLHSEAFESFKRYRVSINLPPIPLEKDDGTVLKSKTGKDSRCPTSLYRDLKSTFLMVADYIDTIGKKDWVVTEDNQCDFDALVANLKVATPHWLRHTAITEYASVQDDLKRLQEFARHSSIETTAIYWHTTAEEIYEAIERL